MPFFGFQGNATGKSRYLVLYLVALNAIIITACIFLHELGHVSAAIMLGCEGSKIGMASAVNPMPVFSTAYCPIPVDQNILPLLGLSGLLFSIPVGLVFLAFRERPEKNVFALIIGFSFILAAADFLFLFSHEIIMLAALSAGIVIFAAGELHLVEDYLSYRRHSARARKTAGKIRKTA